MEFAKLTPEERRTCMRFLGLVLGRLDRSSDELKADGMYVYVVLNEIHTELELSYP